MTIDLSDNSPRASYDVADGATQSSFAVSFEFFDNDDLNVYVDGTLKTLNTDYTVTGGDGSTGTITISVTGASGGSTVVITRSIDLERTTDFPSSGPFNIASLNTELDRFVAIAADLKDGSSRSLQLTDYDAAASLTLPDVDTRKGKTLAFNVSTGAVEAGPSIADVQSVSAASADIQTLAHIEDGTENTDAIQNVAAISNDVSTVSNISANVTTVATNNANVTTVATNIADVTNVSDNIDDVTAAVVSAATASTKANEASTSATAAAASETAAQTAQTNAETAETNAETAQTAAETAETNAETAESNASTSEANAATSETNAATSASNASTSETNASNSATAASGSATAAAGSATAAAASETAAATSETNAATSETNAATSETNAATSETNAATSASTATTQATNAATSATNATTSESNASTSETNAATSATNAATSETNAATSATSAQASKDAALAALDNFDDRYLGQKASDPTVDNDGDALIAGALYFNTSDDIMKVYDGSLWVAAYASLSGAMFGANNLSDVASASDSRSNLGLATVASSGDFNDLSNQPTPFDPDTLATVATTGAYSDLTGKPTLGTAAATAATDYATAAQGSTADSAVQPNDSPTFAGLTTTGDASFGDNDKAIFGDGSDLQIYHDGSGSYVSDQGVGPLNLLSGGVRLKDSTDTTTMLAANAGGSVTIYHDNAPKLATTTTGVDVTGTVTATAFTGDGSGLTGLGGGVPAGAVIYHAASSPPTGFIKANGASLSTTTYADLFAAIGYTFGGSGGSFNVPDLRGEFLRGWDDGRGVDSGRTFGSAQADEFKSHNHTATTSSAGNHRHSYNASGGSNGDTVSHSATSGRTKYTNYAGSHSHTVNVSNAGGSETRPRNVALLACIKY